MSTMPLLQYRQRLDNLMAFTDIFFVLFGVVNVLIIGLTWESRPLWLTYFLTALMVVGLVMLRRIYTRRLHERLLVAAIPSSHFHVMGKDAMIVGDGEIMLLFCIAHNDELGISFPHIRSVDRAFFQEVDVGDTFVLRRLDT